MGLMLTSMDARRRWFGAFFLIIAGGMLLWGLTFLSATLVKNPLLFVLYWSGCMAFTVLAFAVALYDMIVIRRRLREQKRAEFNRAFSDIDESEKSN
ncbi:MAG TPA: phage holin family protein [Verrucomicrobiae bacterium]